MKKVLLLICACLFSFCYGSGSECPDFMEMMGKGKKCWKHVKSEEDKKLLLSFQRHFEKNYAQHRDEITDEMIPKEIHLVWLGPKEYPEKSKHYLQTWINLHPDWKINLWTDREKSNFPPKIEVHIIDDSIYGSFKPLLTESDNMGELSDLLRLIILENVGGVYIDHDVMCKQSFDSLIASYDFFTGLQNPGNQVLKKSAVVRNSIIGSTKHHPILQEALERSKENWAKAKELHPGSDVTSVMERVTRRAFGAFHEAVSKAIEDPNFHGIVFPSGYFNEIEHRFGVYSNEDMDGAWYRDEMNFYEKYLHERVHTLMKRLHFFIVLSSSVLLLCCGLLAFLTYQLFKLKHLF